jgi:uncharacterized OsmC-like protein
MSTTQPARSTAVVIRSGPQGITVTNSAGHEIRIALSPSTDGFNPLELQAAALAVCTSLGIRRQAHLARVSGALRGFQVHADSFKARELPSRVERFELRVTLDGDIEESTRRTIVAEAEKACTIANTLRYPAIVDVVLSDETVAAS